MFFIYFLFLSDEGPMLEMLDHTIRIGSTPTFLYFDLYISLLCLRSTLRSLWYYHSCIRPEAATGCNSSVAFLRVYMEACLKSTCIWAKFVLSAMRWHSWQSGNWQYIEFKININLQDHEKNGPCQSRFLVFLLVFLFYFFLRGEGGRHTPQLLEFCPCCYGVLYGSILSGLKTKHKQH